MDKHYLNTISPIIKDKFGWDAFVAILDYEIKKATAKLTGPLDTNELIRINAQITLLEKLKRTRENALNAKSEYKLPE